MAAVYGTVGETPAQRKAARAWQRYASACQSGGTPAERLHAFNVALQAQRRVERLTLARDRGR